MLQFEKTTSDGEDLPMHSMWQLSVRLVRFAKPMPEMWRHRGLHTAGMEPRNRANRCICVYRQICSWEPSGERQPQAAGSGRGQGRQARSDCYGCRALADIVRRTVLKYVEAPPPPKAHPAPHLEPGGGRPGRSLGRWRIPPLTGASWRINPTTRDLMARRCCCCWGAHGNSTESSTAQVSLAAVQAISFPSGKASLRRSCPFLRQARPRNHLK